MLKQLLTQYRGMEKVEKDIIGILVSLPSFEYFKVPLDICTGYFEATRECIKKTEPLNILKYSHCFQGK